MDVWGKHAVGLVVVGGGDMRGSSEAALGTSIVLVLVLRLGKSAIRAEGTIPVLFGSPIRRREFPSGASFPRETLELIGIVGKFSISTKGANFVA